MERFYRIDKEGYIYIELNSEIYNIVAIKKALLNFIERITAKIEKTDDKILIRIKCKYQYENLEKIVEELYDEFLRESLRYDISIETKNLRELIVGRALYTTCIDMKEDNHECVENNENDVEEYEDSEKKDYDLNEIAVNWFEKNSKEDKLC